MAGENTATTSTASVETTASHVITDDSKRNSITSGSTRDTTTSGSTSASTETKDQKTENVLSSADIQKMIQSTVDSRTAELGKTIADLKRENSELKKANMTAEEIQKADKEEFERQKAEVEFQKRQIYAHRIVSNAGYGENAEAVVDIILGDTDEKTKERLQNFKSLVDKIVAETVQQTFKANGRVPNGAKADSGKAENKYESIAERLGKKTAETNEKSNSVLSYYLGGKK